MWLKGSGSNLRVTENLGQNGFVAVCKWLPLWTLGGSQLKKNPALYYIPLLLFWGLPHGPRLGLTAVNVGFLGRLHFHPLYLLVASELFGKSMLYLIWHFLAQISSLHENNISILYIFHLHCLRLLSLLQITFDATRFQSNIYTNSQCGWNLSGGWDIAWKCLQDSCEKNILQIHIYHQALLQEEIP